MYFDAFTSKKCYLCGHSMMRLQIPKDSVGLACCAIVQFPFDQAVIVNSISCWYAIATPPEKKETQSSQEVCGGGIKSN